ncbi:MAG: transketolase [Acidimicrobiaceae bacterium]|jgi:transketolase|nr:transketolase [Acidimicrobiaceae bacterium]
MRRSFVRTLIDLAERDPRVVLLTGDLGFMVFEPFIERFPDRFFNLGVAEQNMVGVATGLAEAGFVPFTYSIATFASLRAYEFIRNGPVFHQLPVRIVGVGGGFEYGTAGPSHHGTEDIAVMRALPGMAVIAPADHAQAASAMLACWDLPGPLYLRLGKDDHAIVPGLDGRFRLGRAEVVRNGDDVAIIAMGAIAAEVSAAAAALAVGGIEATVVVAASISPAPVDDLIEVVERFATVVTVEAHSVVGGLGSLVSEVVAERGLGCRVVRCGVRSAGDGTGGGEAYLNNRHGLSCDALVQIARDALAGMRAS